VLTAPDLKKLNVINNGFGKVSWSIESVLYGLYLKSEQDPVYGLDKFMILCTASSDLALAIMFDPQGRGKEIVDGHMDQSLFINGEAIPINDYVIAQPQLVKGLISSLYRLDDNLLSKILGASTVGIGLQAAYGAPTYLGFSSMEFSEGAQKLPGFLHVCHRK
jgi:hypothetical protein